MSLPAPQAPAAYLRAAVFRLLDTTVHLQQDLGGYYRTAGLSKVNGIEDVFRWFSKRGVKICLVSELDREATTIILERLGWILSTGTPRSTEAVIDLVIINDQHRNPIERVLHSLGDLSPREMICVGDTDNFLRWSKECGSRYTFAVTYGSTSGKTLANCHHDAILDSPLELPNYLLGELLRIEPLAGKASLRPKFRLRLPTLFG